MDYCNVVKVELINAVINYSTVGYIHNSDKVSFEIYHNDTIVNWAKNNPSSILEDYFNNVSACYLLNSVSAIENGLSLITNLQTPE
jgi:hypothetical protein